MIRPSNRGVATTSEAATMVKTKKTMISVRKARP